MKRPFGFMNQLEKQCIRKQAERLINRHDKYNLFVRRANNLVSAGLDREAERVLEKAKKFELDKTEVLFLEKVKVTKL